MPLLKEPTELLEFAYDHIKGIKNDYAPIKMKDGREGFEVEMNGKEL
jgi:hypothetical protein